MTQITTNAATSQPHLKLNVWLEEVRRYVTEKVFFTYIKTAEYELKDNTLLISFDNFENRKIFEEDLIQWFKKTRKFAGFEHVDFEF
jgi:hypothetical protein